MNNNYYCVFSCLNMKKFVSLVLGGIATTTTINNNININSNNNNNNNKSDNQ